jgi:hypothetical protein
MILQPVILPFVAFHEERAVMMYSKCTSDIIKLISINYHNTVTITLLRRLTANKKIYHFEWRKKFPLSASRVVLTSFSCL